MGRREILTQKGTAESFSTICPSKRFSSTAHARLINLFEQPSMTSFHACKADGSPIGEFTESDFREKIFTGELQPEDYYWSEGMAEWRPVSEYRAAEKAGNAQHSTSLRGGGLSEPDGNAERSIEKQARTPAATGAKDKVCVNCGYRGRPRSITKGSMAVEAVLWLCFLFPGLLYSCWRISSRYAGCPGCGAPNMIPADSPVARGILAKS